MKAKDFVFGERTLSSFGLIMVNFGGSKGLEIIEGAEIKFNTIPSFNGSVYHMVSTVYENCLETIVQVAKHSCSTDIQEISPVEFREISSWLNRKKFLKFKILDEEHIDLYYMASVVGISRIEIDGRLMGLELKIITNSPHALKEPKTIIIRNTVESGGMKRVHTWKKYTAIENTIVATFVENVEIGRILSLGDNIRIWSMIEYADRAIVANEEISLVNPIEISAKKDGLIGVIEEKYIHTDYNDKYIRMTPESEIIGNSSSTIITEAYELSVGNLKDDYIEDVSSENENAYPMDGVQDGYYYVYVNNHLEQGKRSYINDTSYEEGYIYPYTEITIIEDGNLNIHNAIENRDTYIANCIAGEVITMDYPIIKSSISSHNIQNDFNWNFFRIANTYDNSRNDLTISLPCTIKVKYSPIVKVGL